MPRDPAAATVVSAFDNVPAFARGLVRDLRVRWALEEAGQPYGTHLLDAMQPRPEVYRSWQPFGQVPAFADADVRLFESGAILLYLGDRHESLLPRDPQVRWTATSWLMAALNSIEPALMQVFSLDFFHKREPWSGDARPAAVAMARKRLETTQQALASREWFAGPFTVADIMMATVLRSLDHTDILAEFPALAEYKARAEARPAFQQALADQLADYRQPA